MLQELQTAAPLVAAVSATPALLDATAEGGGLGELLEFWDARLTAMSSSIQALEPVLALHIGVRYELLARLQSARESREPLIGAAAVADTRRLESLHQGLGRSWLRLAKSARAVGNAESEANALMQARLHDPTSATLALAKMDWAAGRSHDAMSRLRQQRAKIEAATSDRPSADAKEALGRTVLALARYASEAGEAEAKEVHAMHQMVTELCPTTEKGYFWLGKFHDQQLRLALDAAGRREVEVPATTPGAMSCPSKRVVPVKERERKKFDAHATHLAPLIQSYGAALQRSTKHAHSALPRVLTLWLDYADKLAQVEAGELGQAPGADKAPRLRQPQDAINKLMTSLPPRIWLPCVPQLVSRTCHRDEQTKKLLHTLLAQLLAEYPQQLVWAVVPVALSPNSERRKPGEQIVAQAKQHLLRKPGLEVLRAAAAIINQLRRVCNDEAIDKGCKRVSMRTRFPQVSHRCHLQTTPPFPIATTPNF